MRVTANVQPRFDPARPRSAQHGRPEPAPRRLMRLLTRDPISHDD